MAAERILVVDDEPGVRSALEAILRDEGFGVHCVDTGERGLEALDERAFDAVLLDVWLPGMDGLEILSLLRERNHDVGVVMISGHGNIETAVRATRLGAFDFVEKPLSLEKTLLVLRNALRQRRLERSNRRLLEQLSRDTEIVGNSAEAEELRRHVLIAAESDAPVTIRGERGSGRETVARRIHAAGKRPHAPFVEVPCRALTAETAEHVIFGGPGEPGRIDLAAGGTLFMEAVDRLRADMQRRLAATMTGLDVESGGPRLIVSVVPPCGDLDQDLGQYAEVVRIDVPPLRERRDDIPLLAERYVVDLSREYGREPKSLTPDGIDVLRTHPWTGNLRELRNTIERLLLTVDGDVIDSAGIARTLSREWGSTDDLYREFETLEQGVRAFESYYVRRVLADEGGDRNGAARRLGVTRKTLDRRMGEISESP